jgi:hypothetical protein
MIKWLLSYILLCNTIMCNEYSLPDVGPDYDPILPPVDPVAVTTGFGTSDVNLSLNKNIIESRVGLPTRVAKYASIYTVDDLQYQIEYFSDGSPRIITIRSDRFVVMGLHHTVYYKATDSAVVKEFGQPIVDGNEWRYESIGLGFGFLQNMVNYVFVFKSGAKK